MIQKKQVWLNKLISWLSSASQKQAVLIKDVDPSVLAPLTLKTAISSKTTLAAIFPLASIAEEVHNQISLWLRIFPEIKISMLYLPEAVEGNRFMPENEAERSSAIYSYLSAGTDLLICSAAALLAPVPPSEKIIEEKIILKKGMKYSYSDLLEKLNAMDYDDECEVSVPNEFARRGGLIDIFSPQNEFPVRIEFFGDEIDSMRLFSHETQRSIQDVSEYIIVPRAGLISESSDTDFYDYISKNQHKLLSVYPEQSSLHLERFSSEKHLERWKFINSSDADSIIFLEPGENDDTGSGSAAAAACYPSTAHIISEMPEEAENFSSELLRQSVADQIRQWLDSGYTVAATGSNDANLKHIHDWCEKFSIDPESIETAKFELASGMILPEQKLALLTEKELFLSSFRKKATPAPKVSSIIKDTPDLSAFTDFDEGDFVVHIEHGIGIFKGIQEIKSRGNEQEMIVLEYADGARLYVPLWQANLISRYIGSKKGVTPLSRIGEKKWLKAKTSAARSVREMAMEMLRIQAMRSAAKGFAFPPDDIAQTLFEQSFPYEDTRDQTRSSAEIKADMSQEKPMDRLLCGDVGYGKTEMAVRAAFKCVMAGKQTAILVPTTILAQQHFYTFKERFAEYPIIIEMLSRFKSASEQREIIGRLAEGKVDIVIGTHRLVQSDVVFKDLGLVVIDEEQRFGVEHKENFKKLRATVDILTMTATPIPRTLYMSMTGVRDLSTIMTAPVQRLPVQTIVTKQDDNVIVDAIQREIQRGGQVYYLHNRVSSIEDTCKHLRELMPALRFAAAHGRMDDDELEQIMIRFIDGKIDVLVCTTIIESGLDIPNANTMIIERCDRFGLAELYQLRGRIGRWSRQAFAYLLLPKHDIVTSDAKKRISAIRRYTHLGAGFKLALRDLEIRGAGNLLGAEQSGHINAIGFELYCQLLRSTVANLKGEADIFVPEVNLVLDFINYGHKAPPAKLAASFPPDFIASEKLRMEAYRKLSGLFTLEEIDSFKDELTDRFGNMPPEALRMLDVARLKTAAGRAGYRSVSIIKNKILIENAKGYYRKNGKIPEIDEKSGPEYKLKTLLKLVLQIAKM